MYLKLFVYSTDLGWLVRFMLKQKCHLRFLSIFLNKSEEKVKKLEIFHAGYNFKF